MRNMKQIRQAEQIAREAHQGQTRWDNSSYIEHLKRIANSLDGIGLKIVAWLHDVLEDTKLTSQDLLRKGICAELVSVIETLTRKEGENYYTYIMRISKDPIATKVKIADIEDNLRGDIKEGSLKDKYRLARHILKED